MRPARNSSLCDVISASAGVSFRVGMNVCVQRIGICDLRFTIYAHICVLKSPHEPGGARLRRALTDSCGWEIRARRSLAPPFMVPMRGCKTVETFHEPQKVAQASCLFGADRLEACPTLQPRPGSWLRFTSEFWRCSL